MKDMLADHDNTHRPLLEDRFKLAVDLVSAVIIFHEVGWLHRNLHRQTSSSSHPKIHPHQNG